MQVIEIDAEETEDLQLPSFCIMCVCVCVSFYQREYKNLNKLDP
jgi:hypothetical protein